MLELKEGRSRVAKQEVDTILLLRTTSISKEAKVSTTSESAIHTNSMNFSFVSLSALFLLHTFILWPAVESFTIPFIRFYTPTGLPLRSTTQNAANNVETSSNKDYNSVFVAKEGGRGATTASQQALEQNLSLGAPPARPSGGHYLTKGGLQVTAHVEPLEFSSELKAGTSASAIEELVQKLDDHKGVLLTSSYEFPGRYARWSLGFVDPPLEISGRDNKCTIRALNHRGKVLMPAIEEVMKNLQKEGVLTDVFMSSENVADGSGDALENASSRIDVTVVPPSEVGSFSEEERSRQVFTFSFVSLDNIFITMMALVKLTTNPFSLLSTAIPFFGDPIFNRFI